MKRIKIYEMFLRDGLQSLKPFNLETKINFYNELTKNNYNCIEFGSTTNEKILPQMSKTNELWNYIKKNKNEKTKYTILIPSYIHTYNVLKSKIYSYGLTCGVSDYFTNKNLKMNSITSKLNVNKQIELINRSNMLNRDIHIRIYISCVFGSPKSDENIDKKVIKDFVNNFYDESQKYEMSPDNYDIVLSDTIGGATEEKMEEILDMFDDNIKEYLGLHLHCDKNFEPLVKKGLEKKIRKFDSSILGIGGCPFAKNELVGNISTLELIKYLHKNDYETGLNEDELQTTENNIKLLIERQQA